MKVKQVTTVATDILVCLMDDGSLYSTKLKGRDKNRWIGIKVPNTTIQPVKAEMGGKDVK